MPTLFKRAPAYAPQPTRLNQPRPTYLKDLMIPHRPPHGNTGTTHQGTFQTGKEITQVSSIAELFTTEVSIAELFTTQGLM